MSPAAPDDSEINNELHSATCLNEALFTIAEKYGARVTNNEPRWQDGVYLREVGEFIGEILAAIARHQPPMTAAVPDLPAHHGDKPAMPYPVDLYPGCPCRACLTAVDGQWRMALCPTCGNKRCPGANDHRWGCSGSNDPRQDTSMSGPPPSLDELRARIARLDL